MTREEFLHRHDRFKPTFANALLLGFTAGCAVTAIVVCLCAYLTNNL